MEVLVYGVGGVGGYFGGKIAKAGYNVSMIARGEHLKAIQRDGLEIESINGDFKINPKLATDDLQEVPKPDLVILGIKSWQIPQVAQELKSVIKDNTMILPLQNGADNFEKLLKVFPEKNVLAGLCFVVSYIETPGKIKHSAFEPTISFGEIDNRLSKRIKELKALFDASGIKNFNPENIQLEIWKKFLFITTVSGIGGLTRVSIDKIRESDYLYKMMQDTANEIKELANAKNIPITREHVKQVFKTIHSQPAGTTASTQRDIMNGKPSELDNFNGYIVKEAARLGVDAPVNRSIYECLKPMETLARKSLE
ncbi:ketopantoate reductase family protein [Christiangramia salexigens]|uniref:2-dehydropantoate 2-reductase n=1 Tax=Christiangramia salexigens TaxID=1913577 RepID=A0A1L3J780_9FLAO|nr:2-dehydropantoate 2-reductase [Christiangramia salexigens]APG61002.1 2-dehydropantoate 2-reductase [Christiangramia salexigens]